MFKIIIFLLIANFLCALDLSSIVNANQNLTKSFDVTKTEKLNIMLALQQSSYIDVANQAFQSLKSNQFVYTDVLIKALFQQKGDVE